MPPRFSILVPAFNGASVIGDAVASVLAQRFGDWELVVGDNASVEDLRSVVEAFADPRIRYVRFEEHIPIFDNFNRTFGHARGEWVYLLPTDDRLTPDCLSLIATAIDGNPDDPRPLALVVSRANRIDPQGRPFEREYYGFEGAGSLPTGRHDAAGWLRAICSPGSPPWEGGAFRREIVEEMGVFFRADQPSMSADLELAFRVAAWGDVVYLAEPLISVTGWQESHTTGRRARNRASGEAGTPESLALASALAAHEARRTVSADERRLVEAAMARSYLRRATAHRVRPGGRGRRAALHDVGRAVRLGRGRVLGRAAVLAPVVGLAPASMVRGIRGTAIRARSSRQAGTSEPAPHARRSRTRHAGWGLADQLVASGSNFMLGLAAARALEPAPLGAFAIVFSMYLLALNIGRSGIARPLIVRYANLDGARWHSGVARATGTAVSLGIAAGLGCAALGLVAGPAIAGGLVALAICLPGLLLQDALRYAFVTERRPRLAFVIDTLWAVLAIVPLAWLALTGRVQVTALVLAWGVTGSLAGVVGVILARTRPRPLSARGWVREHRDLLPVLVGSTILETVSATLTTVGIAAIAGLAAAGALRVGSLLLSPAFVVYQAASLLAPPEAARVFHRAPARLAPFMLRLDAGLVVLIFAVSAVVFLIPGWLGAQLLPDNWYAGYALLLPLTVALAGQVSSNAGAVVLTVIEAMAPLMRMSVVTAVLLAVMQLAGAALGGTANGALGAAIGQAIAYPVLAAMMWTEAFVALRRLARRAPEAAVARASAARPASGA
jgi:O-antigen/teichoic acid export membrane protein/GT2 family glycosyltransferase